MTPPGPQLITFDIFGTVVDWRRGLANDLARHGIPLTDSLFDRILAAQEEEEAGEFRSYTEITTRSLVRVAGLPDDDARAIGEAVGRWPAYADSAAALARLRTVAPLMALTNSDQVHRAQVESQLGMALDDWLCAEELRVYKPRPEFWLAAARRRGIEPGPHWWHVSAYADYDLATARSLGLTCVFVDRPHARRGAPGFEAGIEVGDLARLAALAALAAPSEPTGRARPDR